MRWAGALALLLLAAACGPVPQPFRHDYTEEDNGLVRLRSGQGVAVAPAEGAVDDATGLALARIMAERLQKAEIPAVVALPPVAATPAESPPPPALGFALRASVMVAPGPRGTKVTVAWFLADAEGAPVAEAIASAAVPAWPADAPADLEALVAGPAQAMTEHLDENPGAEVAPPEPPSVAILPVVGLEPEGNAALAAALKNALIRTGLTVSDGNAPFVVLGTATVGQARREKDWSEERRPLRVVWTVSARDGRELGTLVQENAVPVAMLRQPWTRLVSIIADAAAQSVGNVVLGTAGR